MRAIFRDFPWRNRGSSGRTEGSRTGAWHDKASDLFQNHIASDDQARRTTDVKRDHYACKDTSLARIIAAYELTFAGAAFMKSDGLTWPLFYTGVFYLIFIGILTLLFNYIERKLDYFK